MSMRAGLAMLCALCTLAVAQTANASPHLDTITVRRGDTLSAIGARCGVAWQTIAKVNRIANPNRLSVGVKLNIPGGKCEAAAAQAEAPVQPAPAAAADAAPPPASGDALAGAAVPAAPPPRPAAAGFGYGVQVHAPGGDQRVVDLTKGMGFNWIKQQVEWQAYEGSKGSTNFSGLDNLVNQANAAGINVLLSIVKAPAWARPPDTDSSVAGPPANPQDMADFMGAMAAHFQGRVKAYEIWNEQNLHYEWGNEPLSAQRYVQLLCATYRAIKANDGGALVISGALTPTGVNDGVRAIDDVTYLSQMVRAGVNSCSDGIGAHPSGYNNPATVGVGWTTAAEPQFKGHRSFYFRGTIARSGRRSSAGPRARTSAPDRQVAMNTQPRTARPSRRSTWSTPSIWPAAGVG
jgi:LysM repeat protein